MINENITVAVHNLGCKVNAYESEAVKKLMRDSGYNVVSFNETADIYIVNTCSVTNIADRKSRQMLHRAKKKNPNAIVVAMGCYAQTKYEEAKNDDAIDLIIGNNNKKDIVRIIEEYRKDRHSVVVDDISKESSYEDFGESALTEHARAFVKIQDGCDNFCSYCIIPYARGRKRSRNFDAVIEEAKKLSGLGYKEVVLTGINLSNYSFEGKGLIDVAESLNEIEGIENIRLGSIEPYIMDDEFLKRLSKLDKVCPHFHISLQSGSTRILKDMNRHYTAKDYSELCDNIRKYYDDPAICTDIIVGFPGEDEESFLETMDFAKSIGFADIHVFKYSRRSGTVADRMDNQVSEQIKHERSERLIALASSLSKEFTDRRIGKECNLLIEEKVVIDGKEYLTGHTREYIKAVILAEDLKNVDNYIGEVKKTKIIGRVDEQIMLATL